MQRHRSALRRPPQHRPRRPGPTPRAWVWSALLVTLGCASFEGRGEVNDGGDGGDARVDAGDGGALTDRAAPGDQTAVDVPAGSLDPAADRTFTRTWDTSVTATLARLDARGRLLLGAGVAAGVDRDFALARLSLEGPDEPLVGADVGGFVRARAVRAGVRLQSVPRAMAVDRQGRVLLVGNGFSGTRRYGVVARWTAEGALDPSFGEAGVVVLGSPAGVPERDVVLRAALAEDDGGVVVTGGDSVPVNRATVGYYARLTHDGALDQAFGGGLVVDDRVAAFTAVARDGDGYALAGESVREGAPTVLYLGAAGRPRGDVGDRGAVAHPSGPMVVRAMRRDEDGGLVIAGGGGAPSFGQNPLRLVRFTAERRPDDGWGAGGVSTGFSAAWWNIEMCHAGALLPWTQGSLLVLGSQGGLRVHRVLRDGRGDDEFGGQGSLQAAPADLQYLFGMTPDDLGGLWVFFRATGERAVGGVHFPARR